jgi:RNA polymerase sigma-70 factor (ECF subfamily)
MRRKKATSSEGDEKTYESAPGGQCSLRMNFSGDSCKYTGEDQDLTNDRELLERIRGRDESAFEVFYRDNAGRLYAYLRQLVGNPQVAEDLMQEAFIQIWRSPNGFRPELGSLRSYLFGVGRKQAALWWRRQGCVPEEWVGKDGSESAEGRAEYPLIADAFAHLSEEQQSLMWLREVEGQSYAELATILQIPLGTVKSRLFAAREKLRRIWQSPSAGARSEE